LRFRVIPVLDVKEGVAVHARKGERGRYQPVKSWLASAPDPVELARAFEAVYGFRELYLADLDAITGKKPLNSPLLGELSGSTSLQIMVDGGFRRLEEVEEAFKAGASRAILATETLPSLDFLSQVLKACGEAKVTVSLDTFEGELLAGNPELKKLKVEGFLEALKSLQVSQLILLDLARVGVGKGVNLELLNVALEKFDGEILVGGGVRGIKDLERLAELGVSGALVATILHERKVKPEELFDRKFTGWH